MGIIDRTHDYIDWLAERPPILRWRKQRYDSLFESAPGYNLFRGVYRTFEEATQAAPRSRPLGYDHEEPANLYQERRKRIFPSDYPALFWLSKLFATGKCRVLDFGGHVGVSYYAYSRYMNYPSALQWTVYDVPAVVRRGREIAAAEDESGKLSFIDSLHEAGQVDIFLAFGFLQYLRGSLLEELQKLAEFPEHVILNLLPVHPSKSYFTVNDIGVAFCPYQIVAEPRLLGELNGIGYECADRWENLEKKCPIPFAPRHSLDKYTGYYFRRGDMPSGQKIP